MNLLDKLKLAIKNTTKLKRTHVTLTKDDALQLVNYVEKLEQEVAVLKAKSEAKESKTNINFDGEQFK